MTWNEYQIVVNPWREGFAAELAIPVEEPFPNTGVVGVGHTQQEALSGLLNGLLRQVRGAK